jgi:hypothetical protein
MGGVVEQEMETVIRAVVGTEAMGALVGLLGVVWMAVVTRSPERRRWTPVQAAANHSPNPYLPSPIHRALHTTDLPECGAAPRTMQVIAPTRACYQK